MAKRLDFVPLVAGLLIALFGVVLLLDAGGHISLRFVALAPIGAFVAGATLLTAGLTRRS
jgi:hypothetical protein